MAAFFFVTHELSGGGLRGHTTGYERGRVANWWSHMWRHPKHECVLSNNEKFYLRCMRYIHHFIYCKHVY